MPKNYILRIIDKTIDFSFIYEEVKEITESGFIDASAVFIDGTHIKANANRNKKEKITVKKPVKQYRDELEEEIEQDRKKHGKKPLKKQENTAEEKEITKDTSDPESGMFVNGEYERCFGYVANTACDRHNFILGFEVGAGNIHDSQIFHEVYKNQGIN